MQRHPVLQKLSEDHHHGLVQCRHLKAAERDRVAGRVRSFLSAWRSEIAGHFVEEEGALLPAVCPPLSPDEPVIATVLAQHLELRRLVSDLQEAQAQADLDACLTLAHRLGTLLEEHIRLEEQQLFERIQSALTPDDLADLGRRLSAWEAGAAATGGPSGSQEQAHGEV